LGLLTEYGCATRSVFRSFDPFGYAQGRLRSVLRTPYGGQAYVKRNRDESRNRLTKDAFCDYIQGDILPQAPSLIHHRFIEDGTTTVLRLAV
jgi:hypothetical protein